MIQPECPEHQIPLVDINRSQAADRQPIFACSVPGCRRLQRLYCDKCCVQAMVPMERIPNSLWKAADPEKEKELLLCHECERKMPVAEGVARWNWEMYHGCVKVMSGFYEKELYNVLEITPKGTPGPNMAWGLFLRTECWLSAVVRMNNPRDIQAIAAAVRAMLEITVDLVFIRHDATGDSVRKMLAWERSNKLHQASNLLRYYQESGQSLPKGYQAQSDFMKNEGAAIEALRKQHWPNKGNRIERWSGHNLAHDCKEADKLEDLRLEHFYATMYRYICWHVHGSGMTGIRELDPAGVYLFAGLGLLHCADLASKIARLVMQEIGDLWRYDQVLHGKYDAAQKAQLSLMNAVQSV